MATNPPCDRETISDISKENGELARNLLGTAAALPSKANLMIVRNLSVAEWAKKLT